MWGCDVQKGAEVGVGGECTHDAPMMMQRRSILELNLCVEPATISPPPGLEPSSSRSWPRVQATTTAMPCQCGDDCACGGTCGGNCGIEGCNCKPLAPAPPAACACGPDCAACSVSPGGVDREGTLP